MNPNFSKTPAGLKLAGTALYGPRWQSALARDLGVSPRFIRFLAAGDKKIPDSCWRNIAALLDQKAQDCKEMSAMIINQSL